MRELNFDFEGIADLIKEHGQQIQLCQRLKTNQNDRDYGVTDDYQLTCRPIIAYTTPESYSQIALQAGNSSTVGGYTCYVSAQTVDRTEFTAASRIIWLDRIYQIQYQLEHLDRGVPRLHQLKLVPSIEPAAVNPTQPDGNFNDYGVS